MDKELELIEKKVRSVIKELEPYYRSVEFGPISSGEGMILKMLVEVSASKNILEIGTSIGVSALWMGLGILKTGGKMITIEVRSQVAMMAKENFLKAGIANIINVLEGNAFYFIPLLKEKFDFVFLDAAKNECLALFNLIIASVKDGGIIVAHDVTYEKEKMQDYIEVISDHPELDTVMISEASSVGCGMSISYKKPKVTAEAR